MPEHSTGTLRLGALRFGALLLPALLAVACLGAWLALVLAYSPRGWLVLGSTLAPHPQTGAVLALWGFFGVLATAFAARAVLEWAAARAGAEKLAREWFAGTDGRWMTVGALLVAAGAVAVRYGVLRDQAIADDEASYRFAAQLIASGRLAAETDSLGAFLDHPFLVNDGRIASVYFPGWPLLAAPFAALGAFDLANALFHAASVPAVFLIARRLWGSGWARAALVVWVSSPFLLTLAATGLSHTTAIAALAWATAFALELGDAGRLHPIVGLATALSVAFCIRPYSTLMVGLPLLLGLLRHLLRPRPSRWRPWLAFLLPTATLAVALLAYQDQLWGSPWKTGYHRLAEVHEASGGRLSATPAEYLGDPVPAISPAPVGVLLARAGLGAMLLAGDLLGWPAVLVAGLVLIGATTATPLRGMLFVGLALGALQRDAGIDSFGPVHFAELSVPALLLVVAGLREVARWLAPSDETATSGSTRRRLVTGAWLAAAILVAWTAWVPLRWRSLLAMTGQIASPVRAVELASAGRRVIAFAPFPWVDERCRTRVPIHFRYQRPLGDPDLEDRILWFNDLGVEADLEVLRRFPERIGLRVRWREDCTEAEAVTFPYGPDVP